MTVEKYFGVFPLRGLQMAKREVTNELFKFDWSVVSVEDISSLNVLLRDKTGFKGNLEMIQRRINPSCFLIVKKHLKELNFLAWRKMAESAETVASGLNALSLAAIPSSEFATDRDTTRRLLPSPIWIPSMSEFCELPLIFDVDRVRMVGHSSAAPTWTTLHNVNGSPVSNNDLHNLVKTQQDPFRSIVEGNVPQFQKNALRALVKSFDSSSVGQFNAQCLGCLDILFNESETKRWDDMQKWTSLLAPNAKPTNLKRLFAARHQFIHRGKEPADRAMHFKSLAVTFVTIMNFAKLVRHFGDQKAVQDILSATSLLEVAEAKLTGFSFPSAISQHLSAPPQWAKDWMDAEVFEEPFVRAPKG